MLKLFSLHFGCCSYHDSRVNIVAICSSSKQDADTNTRKTSVSGEKGTNFWKGSFCAPSIQKRTPVYQLFHDYACIIRVQNLIRFKNIVPIKIKNDDVIIANDRLALLLNNCIHKKT